jgi:hypothetical protein
LPAENATLPKISLPWGSAAHFDPWFAGLWDAGGIILGSKPANALPQLRVQKTLMWTVSSHFRLYKHVENISQASNLGELFIKACNRLYVGEAARKARPASK